MLQMEGTVGIEVRGADSYQSIVRYTMTRYPGSEGNVSEIAFRPSFQDRLKFSSPHSIVETTAR
jgi:hypothetical protein